MALRRVEREVLGRKVSLLHTEAGTGTGFVLLHGIPTGSELWRPLMERMGGARAVAPDLPGYGASEPPANPSIGAYHRFITRLWETEGVSRPVLVGHDLGGLYALTYAVAHPERLGALVLLNTTIYPDPVVALGLAPLLAPGIGEAYSWLAGRERYRRVVRRDITSLYPPGVRAEALAALTEPYGHTRSWLSLVRSLRGLNPVRVLEWKRGMSRLDLPVLIVWGEGDPYFPASVPERLHRDLSRSRLEYLPGAGHFVMLSRPDQTASAIEQFTRNPAE